MGREKELQDPIILVVALALVLAMWVEHYLVPSIAVDGRTAKHGIVWLCSNFAVTIAITLAILWLLAGMCVLAFRYKATFLVRSLLILLTTVAMLLPLAPFLKGSSDSFE